MYRLRHSLRLLVLLLTLSLGVGGQLFGQYYPVHETTVQCLSPQSPENLLSGTSSSEGRVATKQGLKVERVDKIGSFDGSRLAHDVGTVRFEPSAQGRYAFDSGTEPWYQRSVKLDEYYKPFAKGYIAPWKLIPTGEQDVVAARYEGKKAIDLSRVRFATSPNSPALPAELHQESKTWTLKLPAADAQSSYDVFAIYEGEVLGKLRVVSYPKQSYRVRLVSVNGQRVGDVSELSQHLNNIYQQVGVEFRLSETDSFQAELSNGHIKQDLKKLRDSYEEQHPLGKDEVCVFVLSSELSKSSKLEDVEGLMPRKSRFGYIFTGNSPNEKSLARTLAHELGHGLFTLQHSFDDEYGGKQSQDETANLMDYTVGATELVAFQWNILANPAVFTAADKVEEGELGKVGTIWLTPDWEPFIYDASNRILRVSSLSPNGTIDGISLNSKSDLIYKYNKLTRCYEYNLNGRVDTLPVQYVVSIQDDQVVHLVDRYSGVSGVIYKAKWGDIKHSVNDSSLFLSSAVSFLREVGSNQVDDCPKIHVQYIARYICDEIKKNVETSEVKLIRAANVLASNSTHRDPLKGEQPEVIPKIVGNLIAYLTWGYKVKSGAEWDHKKKIREMQKGIVYSCDKSSLNPLQFSYDLWSNIHYGFIGAYAGFTEVELLVGAGVAQVFDNSPEQLEGNAEVNRRIYDALSNRLGAENDDPSDQQAILIGIRLHSEFKNRMSSLSSNDILRAVYRLYKQGLPISVKKCDNH